MIIPWPIRTRGRERTPCFHGSPMLPPRPHRVIMHYSDRRGISSVLSLVALASMRGKGSNKTAVVTQEIPQLYKCPSKATRVDSIPGDSPNLAGGRGTSLHAPVRRTGWLVTARSPLCYVMAARNAHSARSAHMPHALASSAELHAFSHSLRTSASKSVRERALKIA